MLARAGSMQASLSRTSVGHGVEERERLSKKELHSVIYIYCLFAYAHSGALHHIFLVYSREGFHRFCTLLFPTKPVWYKPKTKTTSIRQLFHTIKFSNAEYNNSFLQKTLFRA